MELSQRGYAAQLAAYLENKDYLKAYEFGKEFIAKFPDDMIGHFLLAQAAFWLKRYDDAALEASKAFSKATGQGDMMSCAILRASAYYELQRYDEGFSLLKAMEGKNKTEDLEQLLFLFSMAMNNEKEAVLHLNELHRMNKKAAEDLILKYLK